MFWEQTLHDFCYFKFIKVCFMVQNVVCLSVSSMLAWEECIFWCFWGSLQMSTTSSWLLVLLEVNYTLTFFDCCISPLKSLTIIMDSSILLYKINCFCFTYSDTLVRCILVKDCYVFLEYCLLYHYIMSLFITDNFSYMEVCSVWSYYNYPQILFNNCNLYFFTFLKNFF